MRALLQGTNSADVIKVAVTPNPYLIGNGPTPLSGNANPYFSTGVIARIATALPNSGVPQGPKGLTLVRCMCSK